MHEINAKPEKAIAVAFGKKGSNRAKVAEHLDELAFLADTAGAVIIEKIYQELDSPNPATAIGKGKVEEIRLMILDNDISLVIFDDDLSPVQVKNLEIEFNVKVIDRSGLILDIFAKRAQSLEAKTQVELAQLQYMLPRLTRLWTHLSKQFGGIGTKGPGETQIETDRRIIRLRIRKLQEKLLEITVQKEQQRKQRNNLPRFALIGYTNAGKSTLMNVLSDAGVYVEDKLFATLDTTVRSFTMPNNNKALISDTVGFIRKLPSHLIASFRSTLAEADEADVLLHVVDVSFLQFREHIKAVDETLEFLKISDKPIILVFNKIDSLEDLDERRMIEDEYPNSIFISAKRGININNLLKLMQDKFIENSNIIEFTLPYKHSSQLTKLYSMVDIIERSDTDLGYKMKIRIAPDNLTYFHNNFDEIIMESTEV